MRLSLFVNLILFSSCNVIKAINQKETSIAGDFFKIDFVCPENWTKVPANSLFGINNDFCVMTYEAKNDVAGNAISSPDGAPWVSISANDAKTKCTSLGTNYDLISNPEWMTIAHNVENIASNWTSGSVGSGCLMRGNVGGDHACTGGNSGYNSVNNPDFGSARSDNGTATLTLSNGEEIWDFSGNVWEYTDWIPGGSLDFGPTACPDNSWEELPSIGNCSGDLAFIDFYPSNPTGVLESSYNSAYGLGHFRGGSGGVAIRGGRWDFSISGGIYALNLLNNATSINTGIGFRCVWRPY